MRNNPMREDITPFFVELEKRVRNIEQRSIGTVYVTETIIAKDPITGVETVFGNLAGTGGEGHGLQQWVGDVEPPPTPSAPLMSVSPGIFTAVWSGFNVGDLPIPPDFSHLNVYGNNGTSTQLVGVLKNKDEVAIIATAEYNEVWTFWFTALDYNGNESAPSPLSDPVQLIPMVESPDIVEAINKIYDKVQEDFTKAMVSADGKNSLWHTPDPPVNDPLKPHKDGDTWFDTANGNRISKWVSSPAPGHWERAVLDSGALSDAINQSIVTAQDDATKAMDSADGKNSIWSRDTPPPIDPLKPHKNGDTWFDTANGNRINNWNSTTNTWDLVSLGAEGLADAVTKAISDAQKDADTAQKAADGKSAVWFRDTEPPNDPLNPHKVGDTWYNTSDGNKIHKWQTVPAPAKWVEVPIGLTGLATDVTGAISDAAVSVITDSRLMPGSLSVWPFSNGVIPEGSIGTNELADLSLTVNKFKTNRHHIY